MSEVRLHSVAAAEAIIGEVLSQLQPNRPKRLYALLRVGGMPSTSTKRA